MKKIIIAGEIFDKTMTYQSWWSGETFGGKVIEIEDEYYHDCVREDFDGYVFNLSKYNARKEKELKLPRIAELKELLANTDYQAIKFAEGQISAEDYEPMKLQRQAWRDEITSLGG